MEIKVNVETIAMKKINYMSWQMIIYMIFTKRMVLSNCLILMMLNIRGERKLSFFVCNAKRRQSDVFVRQSQRVKRLTFYEQDNRSDLGASSEFLREQKEGCNPLALRPGASSIRRIGITCYTSPIIIEKFTFKNTFLWHTKGSENHLGHGPLYRPSFIPNMVFYVFHF